MPDFNNYDDLVEEGIRVAKQFSHIKDIKREFKQATGKDLILTDPTYVGKRQDVEDMFKYLRGQDAWAVDTEVIPSAGRVGLITIAAGNKTYAINMNQIRSDPKLIGFFKTKMERYANRDDRHLVFHNRKWDLDHLAKDAIKLFVTDSKGQVKIHDTMVVSRKMGEAGVKGEVGTSNKLGEASLRQLGKVLMKGTSGKLYDYVEDVVKRHGMSTAFLRYGASDVAATLELFKKYYGNTNNPNLSHIEGLTPEQLKKVQEADSLDYIRLTLNKAPPGIHQLLSGNSVSASYLTKDKKNPNKIFVKSYLDPNEFVQEKWMDMISHKNIRARHDELVHAQMLVGKSEQEAKKIAYAQQQEEISTELVSHGINVHSFIASAFKGEAGYNPKAMIRAAPSFVVRQFAKAMGLVGYDAIDKSRHYSKPFFINPSGQRDQPGETPGFFKAIELFHRSYNKVPSVFTKSTMDWLPSDATLNKDSVNSAINKVYGRLKNGNVDLKRLPKGMRIPELPEGIGTKMYVDAVKYLTKYGMEESDVFAQPEHYIHEYQRKLVGDLMGLSDLSKYYHDKEFGLGGFRDMVTATFAGRRWTKTSIPLFSSASAYAERDNALRRGDAKEILWDAQMHPLLDPDVLPGILSFQEKKKASVIKHTVSSSNSKKALEEKSFFEQYKNNLFRSSEIAKYMRFGKGWKKDDEEVLSSKIRNLESQGKTDDEIQNLLQGEEEELYRALRSPVLYRKSAEWTDTARTVVDDELANKLKSTYYDRREGYSPEVQGMIERAISWKDVKVPQIDENTRKYVRDPEGNVLYKTERMPVFGTPDERMIQVGRSMNVPLTTGWYIGTVGSKIHSLVSKKVFRHDLFMKSMPRYNSKVYADTDYGKQVYSEDAYDFMTQNDIMKNIPDASTAKQVAKRIKEMIQEEQANRAAGKGYYSDAQVLKLSRMFTKVMNARVMTKQKSRKMWLDSAVDKFGVLKGQVREASRLIPGRHYVGDGVSEPVSTWQQGIEHPIDRATHDKMAIRYSRGFKEMAGVFEDSNEIGNFMNFVKGISGSYGADEGATKEEKFAHDHVMKSMEDLVKSRGIDKKGAYIDEGQSILTNEQKKMYDIAYGVSDEMKWLENISGTWRSAVRGQIFHDVNKRTPLFDAILTDQEGKPLFRSPISTNDISVMERSGRSFLPQYDISGKDPETGAIQFGTQVLGSLNPDDVPKRWRSTIPGSDIPVHEVLGSFNVAGQNILTNRTLGSTVYQITRGILTPALKRYAAKAEALKAAQAVDARKARQKAMESTFTGSIPVEFEVAHKNKGRAKGTDTNDPATKDDDTYISANKGSLKADDLVYHKQQFNVRYGRDISKIVRDTGQWAARSGAKFDKNITGDTYGTIKEYLKYFGPGGEVIDIFGADYAVHTQIPHENKAFKDLLNPENPHISNKYGDVMIKAIQEAVRRKPAEEQIQVLSDMINAVTGYHTIQGSQKKMERQVAIEMERQQVEKANTMFGFLNDVTPEYVRDYFGDNPMSDSLVEILKIRGETGLDTGEAVASYLDKYQDNPDKLSDYWQAVSAHENMSETSALIDEDKMQELVYNKRPYRFDDNNYFGLEEYKSFDIAMHPVGFTDLDYDVYKNYAQFMQKGFLPAPKMPRIVIPTWRDKFEDISTTASLPTVPGSGLGIRELLGRISGVPDYLGGMGWSETGKKSIIHDATDYESDIVDTIRGPIERPVGMLAGFYDKDKVAGYSNDEVANFLKSYDMSTARNIISGRNFSWTKPVHDFINTTVIPRVTGVPKNRIRKYAEGTPNVMGSLTGDGTAKGPGIAGEAGSELISDPGLNDGNPFMVDKPTLFNFTSATIIPNKLLSKLPGIPRYEYGNVEEDDFDFDNDYLPDYSVDDDDNVPAQKSSKRDIPRIGQKQTNTGGGSPPANPPRSKFLRRKAVAPVSTAMRMENLPGLDVAVNMMRENAVKYSEAYKTYIQEGYQPLVDSSGNAVQSDLYKSLDPLRTAQNSMKPGPKNVGGNIKSSMVTGATYGATLGLVGGGIFGGILGGVGGALVGGIAGSGIVQRGIATYKGNKDEESWGRWESEDARKISSAIRMFEGMNIGDALDTIGLTSEELATMQHSIDSFSRISERWGKMADISATDPMHGSARIANEIYARPLISHEDESGNFSTIGDLTTFVNSLTGAFTRDEKRNNATNTSSALDSTQTQSLLSTLQSYAESISYMGGDATGITDAINTIRNLAGTGGIEFDSGSFNVDGKIDSVSSAFDVLTKRLAELHPEITNLASSAKISEKALEAYNSPEYKASIKDMGFRDVDDYNKYQKKQQRWSNLAAKLKGSGQRGIEETSEVQYSGFFKKGNVESQYAMAGIQRNMEEFAKQFLEPEMGNKWRSAFKIGTGTVQGGEHEISGLSTQMNVSLVVPKDLAKRLGGGSEEGFNKLLQDLVFKPGMKETEGIEKVSYSAHTGQRSTAPTTETSAALRASSTLQGYGRRMTALSMGAMGTYFSVTGIYGAISQGITMVTDSIKDLSSSMKSIAIADSFSNGLLKSSEIMKSMDVSQDDFVEGWKRMQSLQAGFQVFLGSIAASVFKGDMFDKMADGLNDVLSGDAGGKLAASIQAIVLGFIDLLPMVMEFAETLAGVTKFVVDNKGLFRFIAGLTLFAFIAQPILTLFAVMLESIASLILLMGYLGPTMSMGGRAFMQLGTGAFTASNGVMATNGALATTGAMLSPIIGLVIGLGGAYLLLSTILGKVNDQLFIMGAILGGVGGLLVGGPMGMVIGATLGASAFSVAGSALGFADGGEVEYLSDGGESGDPNNPIVTMKIGGVNLRKGFGKLMSGFSRLNRGATAFSVIEGDVVGGSAAKVGNAYGLFPNITPEYAADGGPKGTDIVPTWLTPGEYVVKRQSAGPWKWLLELINQSNGGPLGIGGMCGGGKVQYRQEGGFITDGTRNSFVPSGSAISAQNYQSNTNMKALTEQTAIGATGSVQAGSVLDAASGGSYLNVKLVEDERKWMGKGDEETSHGLNLDGILPDMSGLFDTVRNALAPGGSSGSAAVSLPFGMIITQVIEKAKDVFGKIKWPDIPRLIRGMLERPLEMFKKIGEWIREKLARVKEWLAEKLTGEKSKEVEFKPVDEKGKGKEKGTPPEEKFIEEPKYTEEEIEKWKKQKSKRYMRRIGEKGKGTPYTIDEFQNPETGEWKTKSEWGRETTKTPIKTTVEEATKGKLIIDSFPTADSNGKPIKPSTQTGLSDYGVDTTPLNEKPSEGRTIIDELFGEKKPIDTKSKKPGLPVDVIPGGKGIAGGGIVAAGMTLWDEVLMKGQPLEEALPHAAVAGGIGLGATAAPAIMAGIFGTGAGLATAGVVGPAMSVMGHEWGINLGADTGRKLTGGTWIDEYEEQFNHDKGEFEQVKVGGHWEGGNKVVGDITGAVTGTALDMAGWGAGGAAIGTMIAPGVGTVAGGLIGMGVGAIAGQIQDGFRMMEEAESTGGTKPLEGQYGIGGSIAATFYNMMGAASGRFTEEKSETKEQTVAQAITSPEQVFDVNESQFSAEEIAQIYKGLGIFDDTSLAQMFTGNNMSMIPIERGSTELGSGKYSQLDNKIYIDPRASAQTLDEVMAHEATHAYNDLYYMDYLTKQGYDINKLGMELPETQSGGKGIPFIGGARNLDESLAYDAMHMYQDRKYVREPQPLVTPTTGIPSIFSSEVNLGGTQAPGFDIASIFMNAFKNLPMMGPALGVASTVASPEGSEALNTAISTVAEAVTNFGTIITTGATTAGAQLVGLGSAILETVKSGLVGLEGLGSMIKEFILGMIRGIPIIGDTAATVVNAVTNPVGTAMNIVGLANGGLMTKSGIVEAHAGEVIGPLSSVADIISNKAVSTLNTSGSVSSGGNTYSVSVPITINGNADERTIRDLKRQLQTLLPELLREFDTRAKGI